MKYAVQLILALLTLCGIASGAATDVQLAQRNASNRVEYLTINGASNTWEALRFNGSGVLGSMTLSEWIAGSPAVNWGIIRQTDAGTQTSYIPSADTDAARGTALTTAVAAMGAGDTLWLGAGDYEITTTQLVLPAGSSIIGQGWGTTSITGEKRTNNIKLADNVTLQGLKIITTTPSNSSGHSIIGNESAAYTGVVIRDCYLEGEQDIFNGWGQYNDTDIRLVNCILVSKFDVFNHSPGTGNTITIEGCTILADGTDNPDSSAGLAGLVTTTGVTLNVRNTRIVMGQAGAGGAGPGIVATGSGVANVQDCWITVEAGGYDLTQANTAVVNVTGGRGSGTNGAWSTSGTITHIGVDYAAIAGKQPLDSDLTAIAALTTTAHGLGLLDDANAAASRTSIGVVIGTDVQAYNANTTLLGQTIESAEITDGTISNGDINAAANIELSKLEAPVGTTQAGGWAGNAITTNPYAPTWTTKDLHLFYGANGEIDLPAVSTYGDKTLVLFVDDTHTITVDPNGSETIIVNGASLGAGVADSLSATAGDMFAYYCDGTRWIKVQTGGGGTADEVDWPDITNIPTNVDTLGDFVDPNADVLWWWDDTNGVFDGLPLGTGLDIVGGALVATEPIQAGDYVGTGAYDPGFIYSGDLDGDDSITLTFTEGQRCSFLLNVDGSPTPRTLSFTSAYRVGASGGPITSFVFSNDGIATLDFYHDGTSLFVSIFVYEQVAIATDVSGLGTGVATVLATPSSANLRSAITDETGTGAAVFAGGDIGAATATTASVGDNDTSVATTAFVKAQLVGSDGLVSSGSATDPVNLTFSEETYVHFVGATKTINLPAAAGYAKRGIILHFNGSYVATVDASGSEVLYREGTAQSAGVSITVTGTLGQMAIFYSDGTNWMTFGGTATYTVGS